MGSRHPMLPLAHRRILITRGRDQASSFAAHLAALGAIPILIPTIEIAPPESFASLDEALATLETFDWLVLTSTNAVHALNDRAKHHIRPRLDHPKTAAIGPATARAAREIGLNVALIPPQAVAESLAESLIPHITKASRILLVRAATARDTLPHTLTAAGAHLTIAEAYRTLLPPNSLSALQNLFAEPAHYPDAVTFTSSSTATNLAYLLDCAGLMLPPEIVRASIGPITSRTLTDLGLPPHLESPEAALPAFAAALAGFFAKKALT